MNDTRLLVFPDFLSCRLPLKASLKIALRAYLDSPRFFFGQQGVFQRASLKLEGKELGPYEGLGKSSF